MFKFTKPNFNYENEGYSELWFKPLKKSNYFSQKRNQKENIKKKMLSQRFENQIEKRNMPFLGTDWLLSI